jgi:VCBS repeat-containing protein
VHGGPGFDTLNREDNEGQIKYYSFERVRNFVEEPTPVAPVAVNDTATVARGSSVTINVAANDTSDGSTIDPASITITQQPTAGTLTVNTNGTVTYNSTSGSTATTDTFRYTIDDEDGNTSNEATVTITITAPGALTAVNDSGSITEDATPNTTTGNVLTNDTGGTGTKTVTAVNGSAASVGTNVVRSFGTFNIAANGIFTYTLDNTNAQVNGLNAGQTLTDNITYTVTAGSETSTATLAITITGVTDAADVNNAPVRTGGNPPAINVQEDSANTTAVSLGLSGLTYGPGGSGEEASQTLTYQVTVIPPFINVFKADGTTAVAANDTLTLAELQGLTYKTVANATGTGNLTWTVKDNGGTANGGVDTLTENLAVTVNPINDAPVRTAGSPAAINVAEDSANTTAVTLGLSALAYGPGGGSDEASQTLTFRVTAIPALINVFKADGTTAVAVNDTLTLAELQGLTYKTVANANGTGNLTWSVQDSGGTASGGVDTLNETLAITVNAINDAPSFTISGNPPAVTESTTEQPQTVNNFATNISAGPTDEASQTLTFTATVTNTTGGLTFATPPAIDASGNLTYTPSANSSGTATVQAVLSDNGSGTAPNVNQSAPQTFTITVTPAGPLTANNDTGTVVEDAVDDTADGNVLGNDTGGTGAKTVTAVGGVPGNVGTIVNGSFGTFSIGANGAFTYTLNNGDTTVNGQNDGDILPDSIAYTVSDDTSSETATLTINIQGHTDPPPIDAIDDGANITEDAQPDQVTGNVLDNDTGGGAKAVTEVNGSAANVGATVQGANGFGSFSITSTGQFTYTLDNTNQTVNDLTSASTPLEDTVTYTVGDGDTSDTATLRITIQGVDG